MDLLALLQGLVAQLAALQTQLADVPAALEAAKKLSYDEGFAAGVASVPVVLPSDKIYSQDELDAKIQEALQPVQAELDSVKAQMVDMQVQIDQKIADAIAAFKADLLAKYQDQQVVEAQSETGFADLLK